MRECTKCKSNEYINKNLVMMINDCGHPLCRNCVENLFARNSAPCHVCGKTLLKNNFWKQQFDDPMIEKENYHRKRLRKYYNKKQDDFASLRDFNDYLEHFEELIANLACDVDVEETEARIATYIEENKDVIERNRRKRDEDQEWIEKNLQEERAMKDRVNSYYQLDTEDQKVSAVADSKAIIDELRQSDENAEAILDRERKKQIEIEMEEKEKAEDRKRRAKELHQSRKRAVADSMSFVTIQRQAGRSFFYQPLQLPINGPAVPTYDELESLGYLHHIKKPSNHRVAGGFTAQTGCQRALLESRIDLFAC